MSPLPCAVIGIICYLWSHNKVCHGAFSVIIFLFVSSRAADSAAEPGQAAGARRGRGRAAPMAARAGDVTPSQWAAASAPRPALQHSPQTQGTGSSRGNRAPGSSPRTGSHTDSRRKYSRALNQPRAAPHCGGSAFKRGYWFGAVSGSTLKALNLREQTLSTRWMTSQAKSIAYVRRRLPKLGWPHMAVRGSSGPCAIPWAAARRARSRHCSTVQSPGSTGQGWKEKR